MGKVGLDLNRPIDKGTGDISPRVTTAIAGAVSYVRINFVIKSHGSINDPGWFDIYDQIVDRFISRGIKVYGLIGSEAVSSPLTDFFRASVPNKVADANQWIDEYVETFVAIARHFSQRGVKIFESINEPNDWHNTQEPPIWQEALVSPTWYARILARLYWAVKIREGLQDIKVVSGPLLSHSNHGAESMATDYLRHTFQAGRQDPTWQQVEQQTGGRYPLDGLGYHIYVDQNLDRPLAETGERIQRYTNAIHSLWAAERDVTSPKLLYISEFGWPTNGPQDYQYQSDVLKKAFAVLRADPRVALAIWFCTEDFAGKPYGLYPQGELANPKTAYAALQDVAREDRQEGIVPLTYQPTITDMVSAHHSDRAGQTVQWIVVHSSDAPAGATPGGTVSYLVGPNVHQRSVHEFVAPGNQVYRLVPDQRAALHCDNSTILPTGERGAAANQLSWGIEGYQVAGQPISSEIRSMLITRVAEACRRFGLGSDRILSHDEIDGQHPNEPRGLDMVQFRQEVANLLPATRLHELLQAGAREHQMFPLNREAALQRAIAADNFLPTTGEFFLQHAGMDYVAQRAEHRDRPTVRVYYAPTTDFGSIRMVERERTFDEATLASRDVLLATAEGQPRLPLYRSFALYGRITGDGYAPTSDEFFVSYSGSTYIAQAAENLSTGRARVYYVERDRWDSIFMVQV